jgi:hypothetical protein
MNGLGDMFSVGSGWVARAIESLPREESMGAGDRQLTTLALLLLAGAGTGEAAAQNPSGAIAQPTSSTLHFSGSVLIAGLPADPGAVVQVVVFRTGMSYKVCADATVEVQTTGLTRPPPAPKTFDIYAGGQQIKSVSPRISTPRYGRAVSANVELP